MPSTIDYARRVYKNVNSWYTSADNKAQILLTMNGVFLGFLTTLVFRETRHLREIVSGFGLETVLYLSLMGLCISLSVFCALMCLRSRLPGHETKAPEKTPRSARMWFFADISKLDVKEVRQGLAEADVNFELDALAVQLPKLSRNVLSKHKWVNRGFAQLIASLLFFALMSASYLVRASLHIHAFVNTWLMVIGTVLPIVGFVAYIRLKTKEDKQNMRPIEF